jgi:hypothetical protein
MAQFFLKSSSPDMSFANAPEPVMIGEQNATTREITNNFFIRIPP